ncbi:hypothetical protein SAMN05216474_0049 [Lishizhenia tianjinensis]|uniref:Uncharacterized protein n=1 Tax=Lishizhenia tianjinensis TaxID=477690 RepID=A0A1I6XAM3_9FLAO|nr:hypothetical protein [Lishizhenia tianjinensis]SFT35213.1 hypothetical protein SAMN05216474_0049 [Lishizhenia tianjinensis]
MSTHLKDTLDEVYTTFSSYPLPSEIDGCPCCVGKEDHYHIHSLPLRDLKDKELSKYAFKAMTTWGNVNDFKHFLPRILDLSACNELSVDLFVVLGKLEYGHWKTWPQNEQKAVVEFLKVWWEYAIKHTELLDFELLIELHKVLKQISEMLALWDLQPDKFGLLNFLTFIESYYPDMVDKEGENSDFSGEVVVDLKNWINSKKEDLENAFFKMEKENNDLAQRISKALYILEHT